MDQRKREKVAMYAILYGMGPARLTSIHREPYEPENPYDEYPDNTEADPWWDDDYYGSELTYEEE